MCKNNNIQILMLYNFAYQIVIEPTLSERILSRSGESE
jgi:hypothetical protein